MKCPNCGHNTRTGLTVETRGRKRVADYDLILAVRNDGYSMGEIANIAGVSKGSVQYALRTRQPGSKP